VENIGEGHRKGVDWLLISTPKGEVLYKQFWGRSGNGIDTSEVSANWEITEAEALKISEDVGSLFGVGAWRKVIKEPPSRQYLWRW